MFFRFILRALEYRKQRLMLSFAALAVAATLATILFGIYGTVERRMRDEFLRLWRKYRGYAGERQHGPADNCWCCGVARS